MAINVTVTLPSTPEVGIQSPGIQGPVGPQGQTGPQGPAGTGVVDLSTISGQLAATGQQIISLSGIYNTLSGNLISTGQQLLGYSGILNYSTGVTINNGYGINVTHTSGNVFSLASSGFLKSGEASQNTGVNSIEGLTGNLFVTGTGNVFTSKNGQNIIISGSGGGGTPGGNDREIQFNNNGNFGASSTLVLHPDNSIGQNGNLNVTGQLQLSGNNVNNIIVDSSSGYFNIWIDAAAMTIGVTGASAGNYIVSGTGNMTLDTLDFDDTTQQSASFKLMMPDEWNLGIIKSKFYWLPLTGSGSVVWSICAGAVNSGNILNNILTPQSEIRVTGYSPTSGSGMAISGPSNALTISGSPVLGDMSVFRVSRNPSDPSDTMIGNARLLGIGIQGQKNNIAISW